MPIFITISARLFLREAITVRKMVGILIGFFGVFLVISKGAFSFSLFHFGSTFGDFLVLISALTWTAFTVGGRGFLSRFSALAAIVPIMIVGCLITFPFTWLRWEWNTLFHLSQSAWISILFLGVLFWAGLSFSVFCSGEKGFRHRGNVPLSRTLVTLVGAYFLLGEEIRWITLMGGGMILLGVYLATRKLSVPGPSIPVCRRQALALRVAGRFWVR